MIPGRRAPALLLPLAALLLSGGAAAGGADFPRPPSLESNVRFWRDVYVRWSVNEIVFHDREDLSIVYRVVRVPPHGQRRGGMTRREHVRKAEDELVEVLGRLEAKQPTSAEGLEGLEREVYENLARVDRPDKYRRIDLIRAQNGLREKAREGYIRVGRWEAEVRRILREGGLPEDLIALAFVESLFSLHARSHAGASGMWQFMPGTAREYMQVHRVLDERHDPILATEAAVKYLNQARKRLGPWPVAITSYNYGSNGMARAIKAVGSNDLGVILEKYDHRRFGFAARNYYACFLALVDVMRAPERYFPGVRQDPPWRYDVVRLPFEVLATQLYDVGAIGKRDLFAYNPALTKAARQGRVALPRGLPLRVPHGRGERFVERLASLSERARRVAAKKASPTRYSLLPEARGLEIPKVGAPTVVVEAERPRADERTLTSTVGAERRRVRVRVKLVRTEDVPLAEPLPSVDVLTGVDAPPPARVDAIAGDPGANAPWPLPEGDLRREALPNPETS